LRGFGNGSLWAEEYFFSVVPAIAHCLLAVGCAPEISLAGQ